MIEYIEREAAVDAAFATPYSDELIVTPEASDRDCFWAGQREAQNSIEQLPAADVMRVVHGRWWPKNIDAGCSLCGCGMPRCPDGSQYESDYCPNCGSQMDGGENHAI